MKNLLFIGIIITTLASCIGDDFINDRVDPVLRVSAEIDSLEINTTHQYEISYLNNIGAREEVEVIWSSSDNSIVSIDDTGLATALDIGTVTISAEFTNAENITLRDESTVSVTDNTVVIVEEEPETRSGVIQTTTFYTLEGNFLITEEGSGIRIDIADDFRASSGLPGLYLYLTNNVNSIANAKEISRVQQFRGAQSFTVEDTGIDEYSHLLYFCKPFNVKVGDGEIN